MTGQKFAPLALSAILLGVTSVSAFAQQVFNNGPGDGTVTLKTDGFGAFGLTQTPNGADALYDPVGAGGPAATTFDSGVAFRLGRSGSRQFLTSGSIGGSGGLTNPAISGTLTSSNSAFAIGGLNFALQQNLIPLFNSGIQNGSRLDQVYTISNPGNSAVDFELVRYLDGDLRFDGSLVDGGGKLGSGDGTILFELDSATGASTGTTFVGITGMGGSAGTGRYEIAPYSGLRSRIINGTALADTIQNDANNDGFIDAGSGYDVTMALNNFFTVGAGGSVTYTTSTIFGTGAPISFAVPEPGSIAMLIGMGLTGAMALRRRRKA